MQVNEAMLQSSKETDKTSVTELINFINIIAYSKIRQAAKSPSRFRCKLTKQKSMTSLYRIINVKNTRHIELDFSFQKRFSLYIYDVLKRFHKLYIILL